MEKPYFEQLREYHERRIDVQTNPAVIYVESVKGCPSSCIMCKPNATKPVKISSEILEKLEPYYDTLEVFSIHGDGEPLLADLPYFVGKSLQHDLVLHMNSTGVFLTKKTADFVLQTRLSIRFSIHAGTPGTYYKIMGADLNKVKDQVSYLTVESQKNNIQQDFWFSFLVMKENVDEFGDFLNLAHDCGIRHVRCMRLYPNPNNVKTIHLRGFDFNYLEQTNKKYIDAFYKKMPEYLAMANNLGITIEHGDLSDDLDIVRPMFEISNKVTKKLFRKNLFPLVPLKGHCAAPWLGQMIIEQSGNVNLCCGTDYSLGNINDSSLGEIWRSDRMKSIRKSFHNGVIPNICGFCKGFGVSNYPNNSFLSEDRSQ
ncbi:MAG: SPASM domain-containing protein [Anaerolineaceae bacterium]